MMRGLSCNKTLRVLFVTLLFLMGIQHNLARAESQYWGSSYVTYGDNSGFFPHRSRESQFISLDLDPQDNLDTAFRIAAREDRLLDLIALHKAGAGINSPSDENETALILAARNCAPKTVSFLIGNGAQVNARDSRGRTALIFATRESCVPVVSLLLKVPGIEVFTKDHTKRTALDYAQEDSMSEVDGPSQEIIRLLRMRPRLDKNHTLRQPRVS